MHRPVSPALLAMISGLVLLAGCGSEDPDARTTPAESKVAEKAVADVDAATAAAAK